MPKGNSEQLTIPPQSRMSAAQRYQCLVEAIERPRTLTLNHIELLWLRVLPDTKKKLTEASEIRLIPAVVIRIRYPYVNGVGSAYDANNQRAELKKLCAILEKELRLLSNGCQTPLAKAVRKRRIKKVALELVDTALREGSRTTDPRLICTVFVNTKKALESA